MVEDWVISLENCKALIEFTGKYFEDNIQAQHKTKTEYKRTRDANQKRLLKNFAENQGYLTKV